MHCYLYAGFSQINKTIAFSDSRQKNIFTSNQIKYTISAHNSIHKHLTNVIMSTDNIVIYLEKLPHIENLTSLSGNHSFNCRTQEKTNTHFFKKQYNLQKQ